MNKKRNEEVLSITIFRNLETILPTDIDVAVNNSYKVSVSGPGSSMPLNCNFKHNNTPNFFII